MKGMLDVLHHNMPRVGSVRDHTAIQADVVAEGCEVCMRCSARERWNIS